jgi:hypothetical protein
MAGEYSASSSSSTPSAIQTPQSQWAEQLSQLLAGLAQNQYSWAMGQFNNGLGVTNDQINNYMTLSGMGEGLANNLLGRYQNTFEPIMNQFIQQAGDYNSTARQNFMMGQAESTAGQADTAALNDAAQKLQSYGINPNSGRYQDLITATRMQDAAARAGAGTQASLNTAAIGRQMTQTAAQMGQNVPGMTVNALNSAYNGVTGAVNAENAILNTGANLTNTAANFGNAAANANKLPPVGQTSASGSSSHPGPDDQQQKQQQDPRLGSGKPVPNGSGAGPAMPTGGGGMQEYKAPNNQDQGNGDYATAGGLDTGGANPGMLPQWLNNPTLTDTPFAPGSPNQATSPDNTQWAPPNADPGTGQVLPVATGQGPGTNPAGVGLPDTNNPSTMYQNNQGSFDSTQQPQQGFDAGTPQDMTNYGVQSWQDQQAPQQMDANGGYSSGQPYQPQGQNQGQYQPQGQQGGYQGQPQQMDQNGGYSSGQPYQAPQDQGGGGGYQPQQMDQNGGYSSGGGYQPQSQSANAGDYNVGGYARGGGVLPTSGGSVPRGASPSRGRQTDDVPARLNAGEFVIPRDVTQHFGTKHFQDLIKKSRQLRTGMNGPPAKPKMKPALRMRPTFSSHSLGA